MVMTVTDDDLARIGFRGLFSGNGPDLAPRPPRLAVVTAVTLAGTEARRPDGPGPWYPQVRVLILPARTG